MYMLKKKRSVGSVVLFLVFLCLVYTVWAEPCISEITFSGNCTPDGSIAVYINDSLIKEWISPQIDGSPCVDGSYSLKLGEGCNIHSGEEATLYIQEEYGGSTVWLNDTYDISLDLDASDPIVNLTYPISDLDDAEADMNITFTVLHASNISSCDLIVNGEENKSMADPPTNTTLHFLVTLSHGSHQLYVKCENAFGNKGQSETISINTFVPGTLTPIWIIPANGFTVPQRQSFEVQTSVACSVGDCGDVIAGLDPRRVTTDLHTPSFFKRITTSIKNFFITILRFTGFASGELVKTSIETTPFYTTSDNPQNCGHMVAGDVCNSTWTVHATGERDTYSFFTMYNSSLLATVSTDVIGIAITENNDSTSPVINLTDPADQYVNQDNDISFDYTVSDESSILACELLVQDEIKQTDTSITKDADQFFLETLPNGAYTWKIRCTDNSPQMNNITSEARTIVVNGTEEGIPLYCDSLITADKTLYENMICPSSNGLQIAANDITLDCNGHEISGNGSFTGIELKGHNNVVLKRCNVQGFETGILLSGAPNNRVELSYTSHNKYGVVINNSANNNFYRVSSMWNDQGMYLNKSNNNQFDMGNIKENSIGVYVQGQGNTFSHLKITNNNHTGMVISGTQNSVRNNTIKDNSRRGLYINGGSSNIINSSSFSGQQDVEGIGLYIEDSSQNTITNNVFSTNLRGVVIQNTNGKSQNNNVYSNRFENNQIYHAESSADNSFSKPVSSSIASNGGQQYYQGNYWDDIAENTLDIYDSNGDGYGDGGKNYPYNSEHGKVAGVVDQGPQPALSPVPQITSQAITPQVDPCADPNKKKHCAEWGACIEDKRKRQCTYTNGCSQAWTEETPCMSPEQQQQLLQQQSVASATGQQIAQPADEKAEEKLPAAGKNNADIILLFILVIILIGILAVLSYILYRKYKFRKALLAGTASTKPKSFEKPAEKKIVWRSSAKKPFETEEQTPPPEPVQKPVKEETSVTSEPQKIEENKFKKVEGSKPEKIEAKQPAIPQEKPVTKKIIPAPSVADPAAQALFNKAYAAIGNNDIKGATAVAKEIMGAYRNAVPEHKKEIYDKLNKLYQDIDEVL